MRELSPQTVKDMMDEGKAILIDVREPHEFSEARILGAFNFPLSSFEAKALPVGTGREVILQCGTAKRSGMALAKCAEAGVEVEAHMAGGLSAWRAAGLEAIAVDPSTGQLVRR